MFFDDHLESLANRPPLEPYALYLTEGRGDSRYHLVRRNKVLLKIHHDSLFESGFIDLRLHLRTPPVTTGAAAAGAMRVCTVFAPSARLAAELRHLARHAAALNAPALHWLADQLEHYTASLQQPRDLAAAA